MKVKSNVLAGAMALAVFLGACSGSAGPEALPFIEDTEQAEGTKELVSNGDDATLGIIELEGVAQIEAIWAEAGAEPDVASCQAQVLSSAGYTQVADFSELGEVLSSLTGAQRAEMDGCLQ